MSMGRDNSPGNRTSRRAPGGRVRGECGSTRLCFDHPGEPGGRLAAVSRAGGDMSAPFRSCLGWSALLLGPEARANTGALPTRARPSGRASDLPVAVCGGGRLAAVSRGGDDVSAPFRTRLGLAGDCVAGGRLAAVSRAGGDVSATFRTRLGCAGGCVGRRSAGVGEPWSADRSAPFRSRLGCARLATWPGSSRGHCGGADRSAPFRTRLGCGVSEVG